MSEHIGSGEKRREDLYEYLLILTERAVSREEFESYRPAITAVRRRDTVLVVDRIMRSGMETEQVKRGVDRFITGVSSTLLSYPVPEYPETSILRILSRENTEGKKRMEAMKPLVQRLNREPESRAETLAALAGALEEMEGFDGHYVKLENVLFPALERLWDDYRCTRLMWSYHDDIRKTLAVLRRLIGDRSMDLGEVNRTVGRFFFDVYGMIFREEHILFPEIHETVAPELLEGLLPECFEIGFAFIEPGLSVPEEPPEAADSPGSVAFRTGTLTPEQLNLVLDALPVDITLVDENDQVAYFSDPPHRIFPRSPAIVGRKVQNCHPPESIGAVQRILDSFRAGDRDTEDFWIRRGEGLVLIRYIALRGADGSYRGTLEVSQEVGRIRELRGEKRL